MKDVGLGCWEESATEGPHALTIPGYRETLNPVALTIHIKAWAHARKPQTSKI